MVSREKLLVAVIRLMCFSVCYVFDLETRGLQPIFRSDICVIGGGVAGILLASLLEAGGFSSRSEARGSTAQRSRVSRTPALRKAASAHLEDPRPAGGASCSLSQRRCFIPTVGSVCLSGPSDWLSSSRIILRCRSDGRFYISVLRRTA